MSLIKRYIFLLAAAILAVTPTAALAQEESFLVGFAQDNMSSKWRAQQVFELEGALKKFSSIKFVHTDAQGSIAKAARDIEDLHDMGVDLLVVSPQSPTGLNTAISSVYKSGIPVVLITRHINSENFTTFIAPDDHSIAMMAADEIAEILQGEGDVFILQGLPTATTAIDRTNGFLEQLKKYKNIRVSGIISGNYSRGGAIKATASAIESGIPFDAIYAQSDTMAVGARIALEKYGLDPRDIPLVGIDYRSEARAAIKAGLQSASFTYPMCGKEAADVIWDILQGKPVEKHIVVPSQKITINNVNDVESAF